MKIILFLVLFLFDFSNATAAAYGNIISGASISDRPATGLCTGYEFYDLETENIWKWNGATWILVSISTANLGSGTADATTFLRGDKSWQTVSGGSTPTGTGFRHVTAGAEDAAAKLVETADITDAQVTLAKQANLAANSIQGNNTGSAAIPLALTVSQTRTLLTVNNTDNTSDANKPVFTATQTALDLKANLTSNTFSAAQTLTGAAPQIIAGVNVTTLGSVKLFGNTSGDATIRPAAIAGTATVVTLPNASSTLPIFGQQITFSGPTAARTVTFPDASFTVARTDAANTFTGVQTMTSPAIASPAFSSTSTGTYTLGGTLTINAFTLGGTISGGGNQINNVIIGTTSPLAGKFTTLTETALLISNAAPTISSGFGSSPSISSNNGTAAFRVNVGTGGSASTGVIGLPTASTGWNCTCTDITTHSTTIFLCRQTASSTTTATIGQFTTADAAGAWGASNILAVSCFAY